MSGKKASFIDYLALILLVIGGINWGLMGVLQKDLIMGILGFTFETARIIYVLVGLAGVWGLFSTLGKLR